MTRRRPRRKHKLCESCHQGFWANRRDARFCGDSCRQRAFRDRKRDIPVTEAAEAVTEQEKPKSQFAHNIATAEAWIAWRKDNHPRIEDIE